MTFLNQLKDLVSKAQAKITDGLSKVAKQIDERTDGKYSDKLKKLINEDIDLTDAAVDVTDDVADAADTAADAVADAAEEITGN